MKNETEKKTSSRAWIVLSMAAGLCFGLGNTVFGLYCAHQGIWGAAFTGPLALLLTLSYRMIEAFYIKSKTGHFIDKANSNYWKPWTSDDDY